MNKDLYKSKDFSDCVTYLNTIMTDIFTLFFVAAGMRSRGGLKDNCILFSSVDFLIESITGITSLQKEGIHNPIKRELRYLLEASITFSYVEQHFQSESLNNKISLFDKHVSINVVDGVNFRWLNEQENLSFKSEIKDLYKKLCQYTHPSNVQIEEYQKRLSRGNQIGYESIKDIQALNKIIFRVYDILCICALDCVGLGQAGDLFIYVFDEDNKWKFHKGKYTKLMSKYFDYKHERKNKQKN